MNEDLIIRAKLAEKGFMPKTEDAFVEESCPEDRVVAIIGSKVNREIFVAGKEMLEETGSSYKSCLDDIPESGVNFYNQRVAKDEMEISSLDNMMLIERHESNVVRRAEIENRDTRKTKRSVKGLRNM